MSRKPGSPLFAVLVTLLVVLLAPTAQAKVTFEMPAFATLRGEGTGSGGFVTHGIGIACEELTIFGEAAGPSPTLEVLPEYSKCTAKALTGFIADFFQEACDYRMHDAKRLPGRERWTADVDIKCHNGYDSIGWDFYETEKAHREAHPFCSMQMPEGPDIGTAEMRNLKGPRGGIEIHWRLPTLDYRVLTLRGPPSSLFCGSTFGDMRSDASYSGSARVFATDPEGNPENLSLSG